MVHRSVVVLLAATILSATVAGAGAQDGGAPAGAQAAARLHPSELMTKAPALLQAGRGEEATFWFYAGQLRWRSRLGADPAQDPSGEPALFSSLFATIGPPVNEWAFGDIAALQRTIDAVLRWDSRYPDPSLPASAHAATRRGLQELRDRIGREAGEIRAARTAAGLANR